MNLLTRKKIARGKSRGIICVRHRAGQPMKHRIVIDKWRYLDNIPGILISIKKSDVFSTGFLGKVVYFNGLVGFILLPENLIEGDFIISRSLKIFNLQEMVFGNSFLLLSVPLGITFFNVENQYLKGGVFVKSAGSTSMFLGSGNLVNFGLVSLPSGNFQLVPFKSRVSIGIVSNSGQVLFNYKKAGVKRNLGYRPKVRGVAMNPVDHPHGGGEGKTSGGRHPVSP